MKSLPDGCNLGYALFAIAMITLLESSWSAAQTV